MVILKRIFSETGLFDPVKFKLGINVILGVYAKGDKKSSGLNGIGKSTLVRLIDYMFISTSKKNNHFNPEKYPFLKDQNAVLEFEVEGQSYFIRRAFSDPDKIKFGKELLSLETYTEGEMKNVLSNLFFNEEDPEIHFENGWFRDLVGFFIKDDMDTFDRKDPLNFVSNYTSKFDVYTYNLFLLGLPNEGVYKFSILNASLQELQKQKNKYIARVEEETGKKIEEISSDISEIERKISVYEKSLENHKFLEPYKEIEAKLIEISQEISEKLRRFSFVRKNLDEYKKSYEYSVEIDPKVIAQEYLEVKQLFGDIINKKLEETIEFRKTLSDNRKMFLKDRELELELQIKKLSEKIAELEERRSELYDQLEQKNALDTLKNSYLQLIEEKTKKAKLLSFTGQIESLDRDIYLKIEQLTKSIQDIKAQLDPVQDKINEIAGLFLEITKKVVNNIEGGKAVFSIKPTPDMRSPLTIIIEIPKSKALGKSRFKILVYDLSVFLNIVKNKRKLPHFLVHDGVFHSIDIKTIVETLNYINLKYAQSPDFQYIITANESEILFPDSKKEVYGEYEFDVSESIVAKFTDDPNQMFFKKSYD